MKRMNERVRAYGMLISSLLLLLFVLYVIINVACSAIALTYKGYYQLGLTLFNSVMLFFIIFDETLLNYIADAMTEALFILAISGEVWAIHLLSYLDERRRYQEELEKRVMEVLEHDK